MFIADPGYHRIPEPIFTILDPGSRVDKIPDPDPYKKI
jgi:hypothetical protein